MKDELGGRIMTKFVRLTAKIYSYLIDDGSEDKQAKDTKKCLETTQLENKANHLEKNKINIGRIKENHKEFIKNNKSILKTQQRYKNERHNVFTEEINKIALNLNDDKRM